MLGVVVEQQEWIELLDDVRDGREVASHAKAVADPMQARRAINAFDFAQTNQLRHAVHHGHALVADNGAG